MSLSDREAAELACLTEAHSTGQLPDGCDEKSYLARGYLVPDGSVYVLTPDGAAYLDALRHKRQAGISASPAALPEAKVSSG